MKMKILKVLNEHPGLRKREIASYLHCHHFTLITTLYEMEEDGLLTRENVHDTANMEFYEKYFISDHGKLMLEYSEGADKIFKNLEIRG